jgi:hypothetical protein
VLLFWIGAVGPRPRRQRHSLTKPITLPIFGILDRFALLLLMVSAYDCWLTYHISRVLTNSLPYRLDLASLRGNT